MEAQNNAAEILAALAQSQVSPLTRNLAEPQFLELLVQRALQQPADGAAPEPGAAAANGDGGSNSSSSEGDAAAAASSKADEAAAAAATGAAAAAAGSAGDGGGGGSSARMHALNVCISLVEPLPPSPAEQQAAAQGLGLAPMPAAAVDVAVVEVHATMRAQAIQCISKSIDRLVDLLEAVDADHQLPTSYGLLQPPVGLARIKAVELLAALLHSGDEAAGP